MTVCLQRKYYEDDCKDNVEKDEDGREGFP